MARKFSKILLGSGIIGLGIGFFACPKSAEVLAPIIVYRNLNPCLKTYPPEPEDVDISTCPGYAACLNSRQYIKLVLRMDEIRLWMNEAVIRCNVEDPDAGVIDAGI